MVFFSELDRRLERLRSVFGECVEAADLPAMVDGLDDEMLIAMLTDASDISRSMETLRIAAAGAAARRSSREHGHSGLAQKNGHRSPASLIQHITGATRGEANKQVRLGESLLQTVPVRDDGLDRGVDTEIASPWHAPLGAALLAGALTRDQHDAIFRGLGQPPVVGIATGTIDPTSRADDEAVDRETVEVWRLAAGQLAGDASDCTVEDLFRHAQIVRDQLDPAGVARRFDARYDARSFRMWRDDEGAHHAHIAFDDEMAAWVRTIIDSAMRPRRGGPRFVDAEEAARAKALVDDPRSNDQLSYDLLMDVLRAGALAEPAAVFGTRQAGVRVVVTRETLEDRDAFGRLSGIGHLEDGGDAIPASIIDRQLCEGGHVSCTFDAAGNPLDLGREQRLFSPRQRIALAIRDGGCMWSGCGVPASYCEAHHADHYVEDRGRTDIDRGVLLCRFHHMTLHSNRWRITRRAKDSFFLHPPDGSPPVALRSKSPFAHRWAAFAPSPAARQRFAA